MIHFWAILLGVTLTAIAKAEVRSFSFGAKDSSPRPALLFVPTAKKPAALLVVLHGGSRNAHLAMNQDSEGEWNQLAETYGWVVLYPSGTTNQKDPQKLIWNDCRLKFGEVGPAE